MRNITTPNNKRKVHRFGVLLYCLVILKILLLEIKKCEHEIFYFAFCFWIVRRE
jgi:hypothetical protein